MSWEPWRPSPKRRPNLDGRHGCKRQLLCTNRKQQRLLRRPRASPPSRDYEEAIALFISRLPPGGSVVGIGSGDGRHLVPFTQRGFQVLGVEPSPDRRAIAESRGVPTIEGTFENLPSRNLSPADGVWCGAALRHVPEDFLARALRNVAHLLKSDGVLFLTVELGESSEWLASIPPRGDAESLSQQVSETYLARMLSQQGFLIQEKWYPLPSAGRSGQWIAIVASKA